MFVSKKFHPNSFILSFFVEILKNINPIKYGHVGDVIMCHVAACNLLNLLKMFTFHTRFLVYNIYIKKIKFNQLIFTISCKFY